jgi:hypothetical protein
MIYSNFCSKAESSQVADDDTVVITTVNQQGFVVTFEHESRNLDDPKAHDFNVKVRVDHFDIPRKFTVLESNALKPIAST